MASLTEASIILSELKENILNLSVGDVYTKIYFNPRVSCIWVHSE